MRDKTEHCPGYSYLEQIFVVLFCILLHVIPLPVVAVMRPGCKHAHQWNLISGVSPRLAVLVTPHAEDNILVVLLLLLFSSLVTPLVFLVLAPVFLSLTLVWFSCIGSLPKTYNLVKICLQRSLLPVFLCQRFSSPFRLCLQLFWPCTKKEQ